VASTAKAASTTSGKPAIAAKAGVASAKPAKTEPTKISIAPITPQPKQGAQKAGPFAPPKRAKAVKAAAQPVSKPATQSAEAAPSAPENKEKKMITAEGRRDPFLSPVVNSATGPVCSTGKRCLEIDQIVVRGVVKSDTGMIAVVVNALNKAYFLKENDPVFNGYVMKITGDSVVFKETYQDKLGKEFTREIVKKLTTPAV
jgi:Tfp pilus assembly protein PilP